MVLGYFLVNYTSLADGKLTKQANAIVFKIFLPCMLFYNVYQSDIGSEIHSRIRLCMWAAGGLLILFVLLCLIVPRIVTQENQQGVVIQGIFRSNYVIFGVAVVQNMYGPKSTTTAAILSAILVPMYNCSCQNRANLQACGKQYSCFQTNHLNIFVLCNIAVQAEATRHLSITAR